MGVQRLRSGKIRRGRGGPTEVQRGPRKKICKWEEREEEELSRLLFGYVQHNGGKLPRKSDAAFWKLCCNRFKGRFTALQVHDKARNLKLRFLRLSSGPAGAKAIKLCECDIFRVWSQIMNPSPQGINGMEGPSKGNTPRAGGDKGGVGATGEACDKGGVGATSEACEEGQDTSTCSTAYMFQDSPCNRHGHNGTYTMHASDYVDTTPGVDDQSAHNMTLLQHGIVADLASTTKTLANFVYSQATA